VGFQCLMVSAFQRDRISVAAPRADWSALDSAHVHHTAQTVFQVKDTWGEINWSMLCISCAHRRLLSDECFRSWDSVALTRRKKGLAEV
jgi:hypothetical protein